MGSFLGWKLKDVLKVLPQEKIKFDIDYPFQMQEAFGDLRVIMEKEENGYYYFTLSYENYQERR